MVQHNSVGGGNAENSVKAMEQLEGTYIVKQELIYLITLNLIKMLCGWKARNTGSATLILNPGVAAVMQLLQIWL